MMAEMTKNMQGANELRSAKRLVIKAGSALLLDQAANPATRWLSELGTDIAKLRSYGAQICIVSSGAIGIGKSRLKLEGRLKLEEKQAAAAAGQSQLMQAWQNALQPHGLITAQILLTLADTENRRRYLNARATIETLLEVGAVPIINENDTIATDEIRYGDNDRLAAHVAQMCGADALVMLTDIDGLYDADPHKSPTAQHISLVDEITAEIAQMGGGANTKTGLGSGGMATKIEAAKIAAAAGCWTYVAKGDIHQPLSALLAGEKCTRFKPNASPEKARRSWIAGQLKPAGKIIVDDGAAKALHNDASLLSAGITAIDGDFYKGDTVSLHTGEDVVIAQGISSYDSADLREIIGLQSSDIEHKIGYRRAAVIHRNDLVLLNGQKEKK